MKIAVAHCNGFTRPTDLTHAEALAIYQRQGNSFIELEERPVPRAPRDSPVHWAQALCDCQGLLARSVPPRIALELQRRDIFPMSGAGFGPDDMEDALAFLAACLGCRDRPAA